MIIWKLICQETQIYQRKKYIVCSKKNPLDILKKNKFLMIIYTDCKSVHRKCNDLRFPLFFCFYYFFIIA